MLNKKKFKHEDFLKLSKDQIEKVSSIISNAELKKYNSIIPDIIEESKEFFGQYENEDKEFVDYIMNEQLIRADFFELAKQNSIALSYYNVVQKLKPKISDLKHFEEFMPFCLRKEILEKLLKRNLFSKVAEDMGFELNAKNQNSSFDNFLILFKAYFYGDNIYRGVFEYKTSCIIREITQLFDKNLKSGETELLKNNNFYSKLKSLTEQHKKSEVKLSQSEKLSTNKSIIKELINYFLETQSQNGFEEFKKIATDNQIEAIVRLNAEKNIENWELKSDKEFNRIKLLKKLLKFFLKQEHNSGDIIKEAEEINNKLKILKQSLQKFQEEFKQDSYYKIIKSWKNRIEAGKFSKKEISDLFIKLSSLINKDKIFALKQKDKNLVFEFIMNLLDVLCNVIDEEVEKIYVKNFIPYLKNVKGLLEILKNNSIDVDEYYLLINRRIKNLEIGDMSYTFSREVDNSISDWIVYLNE